MFKETMYPADLKLEVRKTFQNLDDLNRPVEFPSDSALNDMLESCFLASLLKEETRQLEFRLGYCEPTRLKAMANPSHGIHWVPLQTPRLCTDSELRRLAPAFDATRSIICCYEQPDLKIVGILTTNSDFSQFSCRSALSGRLLPDVFNVSTAAPGELRANCGDFCYVQLRNGRLRYPRAILRDGPILRHLIPIEDEMQTEAWNSIQDVSRPDVGWVATPYFPFLARLLHTIDRGCHGGSMLVVPQNRASELTESVIRIKYRMAATSAWRLCRDWVARIIRETHKPTESGGTEFHEKRPANTVEDHYQSIMRFAEFVGKLGRVDGAVVLTDRLEVIGFGAEIAAHIEHVSEVTYHPDSKAPSRIERVDENGTRHRSVVRFCQAVPGTVGFILSQDGGMKAVKLGEGGLEMWGDVLPSLG